VGDVFKASSGRYIIKLGTMTEFAPGTGDNPIVKKPTG
jgi:hypothetical protein